MLQAVLTLGRWSQAIKKAEQKLMRARVPGSVSQISPFLC